jgi:lipopolysaccharide transport system ATP-binding protein
VNDSVIAVEHLSKRYVIGHQRDRRDGLSHVLERALRSPLRWFRDLKAQTSSREEFWALRDLNLEIRRGEVVGIIGRNGAGKSTLLKILSRITEPTEGRVRIRGRVASLLEVGTGFHTELTGRENVFLNGAILGMSRAEIQKKFDEITEFAEVGRFLDTPVKRYSSGMQVRLAFAVAAHLDPEILIVDEVLAVGDLAFQRKCLGRMRHVSSQEGRTVLFVSHNTGALSNLCTRGVVLDSGTMVADTDIHAAMSLYLKSSAQRSVVAHDRVTAPRIVGATLNEQALQQGGFEVRISFVSPFELDPPIGGVVISDLGGVPLIGTNPFMHPEGYQRRRAKSGVIVCRIPKLPLHSGEYGVSVWLADTHQNYDVEMGILVFHFSSPDFRPEIPPASAIGPVNVSAAWSFEETTESMPVGQEAYSK